MDSHLASLPNEILDFVFAHFEPREADLTQARLIQCNSSLRRRFERRLYSRKESCDRIVRVACERGLIETIKLAIGTFGASPSVVTICGGKGLVKVLTLHLAARKMQPDAFELLLKLGARIDVAPEEKSISSQISCIVKALQLGHVAMLHPFFVSGTAAQVPHIPIADDCLVQAIINRASFETVRLLLDHGANPNHIQSGGMHLSALSAAAMTGATETFRLLLERGADLNVRKHKQRSHIASLFEVPVIAAAHAMAEFQTTEMLQLCLEYGASLDTTTTLTQKQPSRHATIISPLSAYLDAIIDWQSDFKLSPFDAVSFMLNHHREEECWASASETYPGSDFSRIGKVLEILLDKWGVGHLVLDEFFNVVWLLAENSGRFHLREILRARLYEPIVTYDGQSLERWFIILDVLLQHWDVAEKGKMLYNLILDWADFHISYDDDSAEVLINHLIQSGADINVREYEDGYSRSVLHAVCDLIDEETRALEQSCSWHFVGMYHPDINRRGGLLQTIVRHGGNPKLKSDGKDALDRLRRTKHKLRETRIYVSYLVGYLNCTDRLMEDLSDFVELDGLFGEDG